jgi:calcium-binding protein CML
MAVKNLKQNATAAAEPCTSSSKRCTSPSKISKVFSKMVPFLSKSNSGKEESSSSSLPPTITTQLSRSSELQRIFCYFDENGDGKISPSELRDCMRATGLEGLSLEEAEEAVHLSDSDGDGELGLEDFVKLVETEDEQEKDKSLMDAFRM